MDGHLGEVWGGRRKHEMPKYVHNDDAVEASNSEENIFIEGHEGVKLLINYRVLSTLSSSVHLHEQHGLDRL